MATIRKWAVALAFLAGIGVPLLIEFGGRILHAAGMVNSPGWWSTVFMWLWPTALWLIGTSEDLKSYVAFIISVVANGALYALIAVAVRFVWGAFTEFDQQDWWPGGNPR